MSVFRLSEPQGRFVTSDAVYPAFVGGFGSGKTQAMAIRALRLLIEDGGLIAVYMPTFDLIKLIGIPRFQQIFEQAGIRYENKLSEPSITTDAGKVLFRTMEKPERIIGYESCHAFVDELDTLPKDKAEYCWRMILSRNRAKTKTGRPNTVGVTTTPEGYRFVYESWKKKPLPDSELIQASTYSNERNLPAGYIDGLKAQYPSNLIQAYLMGEFVNLNDGLFDPDWLKRHPVSLGHNAIYFMGVDLAISKKETADNTAIVVIGVVEGSQGRKAYVVDCLAGKWTMNETVERVQMMHRKYGAVSIGVETVAYQQAAYQQMGAIGLPVVPIKVTTDKITRAIPVAAALERGDLMLADSVPADMIDELQAFPSGAHDDMVDALAHAWQMAHSGQGRVGHIGGRRL